MFRLIHIADEGFIEITIDPNNVQPDDELFPASIFEPAMAPPGGRSEKQATPTLTSLTGTILSGVYFSPQNQIQLDLNVVHVIEFRCLKLNLHLWGNLQKRTRKVRPLKSKLKWTLFGWTARNSNNCRKVRLILCG